MGPTALIPPANRTKVRVWAEISIVAWMCQESRPVLTRVNMMVPRCSENTLSKTMAFQYYSWTGIDTFDPCSSEVSISRVHSH